MPKKISSHPSLRASNQRAIAHWEAIDKRLQTLPFRITICSITDVQSVARDCEKTGWLLGAAWSPSTA